MRREAVAQARREAGVPLAPAKGAGAPSRAAEGSKAAALAEHDFSHWARGALAARLGGLRHARAGATVVVDRMDEDRSEVTCNCRGHCSGSQTPLPQAGVCVGRGANFGVQMADGLLMVMAGACIHSREARPARALLRSGLGAALDGSLRAG